MFSAACEHLLNLAAIIYRPEEMVDRLLEDFANDLINKGHRVGGLVQRNKRNVQHPHGLMELIDLMTGHVFYISQASGANCRLDPSALANAALVIGHAVEANAELVIVNKFSTQEAAGKGLRNEIAIAVSAGLPVLTAVPERHFSAWLAFTEGFGTTITCERMKIDTWWQEVSWQNRHKRAAARLNKPLGVNSA